MSYGGGPTGTVRNSGPAGNRAGGSGKERKSWGDTTSKRGELSRIFIGGIDSANTNCEDIGRLGSKGGKEYVS